MDGWADNTVVAHDAATRRWLAFEGPRRVLAAARTGEVVPVLRAVEEWVSQPGRFAAGFVGYEAAPGLDPALIAKAPGALPLAWFGLYGPPREVPAPGPVGSADPAPEWTPSITRARHRRMVQRIRVWIRRGDTYQVNATYRLRAAIEGDPWDYFARMTRAQHGDYGAFVRTPEWAIASASPELFFRLDGRRLVTRPMKGTAARAPGAAADREHAAALRASAKDRAENVMIVDMARNDLGRVAAAGSVSVPQLFEVERYPTLWQMTSTVCAETDAGLAGIFGALFPAASITGAPKARTMQLIAKLEDDPRGIYTGAIGFVGPGRTAQFNVAIRTVAIDRRSGSAEYGVGGGIVWDSRPGSEWEECRTKALVLTRLPPPFALLETLRWTPGEGYALLGRHLARLADSADYFGRRVDPGDLRRRLAAFAADLAPVPQRVRLLVPERGEPEIEAQPLAPLPAPYRMRLAAAPVDPADPFLRHKTTHRRVYDEARAAAPGADDVLLWNGEGEVTESCIGNLVYERDGGRWTPPLTCGLLAGTARAERLERGEIAEHALRVDDLPRCPRLWLVNSVRGMWPVTLAREA